MKLRVKLRNLMMRLKRLERLLIRNRKAKLVVDLLVALIVPSQRMATLRMATLWMPILKNSPRRINKRLCEHAALLYLYLRGVHYPRKSQKNLNK